MVINRDYFYQGFSGFIKRKSGIRGKFIKRKFGIRGFSGFIKRNLISNRDEYLSAFRAIYQMAGDGRGVIYQAPKNIKNMRNSYKLIVNLFEIFEII
mgnify:CR=1 FL=1